MQEGKHVPDRLASSSKTSAPRDSKEFVEAWTGSGFAVHHFRAQANMPLCHTVPYFKSCCTPVDVNHGASTGMM